MRSSVRSAAVRLVVPLACGISLPAAAGAQDLEMASISGIVVSESTGSPIVQALVHLVGADRTAITDAEGRFSLPALAAGSHVLQVSRLGYESFPLKVEVQPLQQLRIEAPIPLRPEPQFPAIVTAWEQGNAEGPPGSLTGAVVDRGTNQPILGAFVGLEGESTITVSGEDGRFLLGRIEPGLHTLSVRRIGYRPMWLQFAVEAGEHLEVDQVLIEANPTELDELVVTADGFGISTSSQFAGFIDRAKAGFGHFVTARDIERRHPLLTTDLLFGVPGVRVTSVGSTNRVEIVRTDRLSGRACPPVYYIDGMRLTDINLDEILIPESVAGIEIYRRASEIPVQFNAPGSACGVIVVWTK